MAVDSMRQKMKSSLEEMVGLIEGVEGFLDERGVGLKTAYSVNLVLEEVITNIIKYGYDDQDMHEVRVEVGLRDGGVGIVIEDDGHEFNPLEAEDPDMESALEDREPGGLGLFLTKSVTTEAAYVRSKGMNVLTLFVPER